VKTVAEDLELSQTQMYQLDLIVYVIRYKDFVCFAVSSIVTMNLFDFV